MLFNFIVVNINMLIFGVILIFWSGVVVILVNGIVFFDLCFMVIGIEDICLDVVIIGLVEFINFISSMLGSFSFSGEEGMICINFVFDGFWFFILD